MARTQDKNRKCTQSERAARRTKIRSTLTPAKITPPRLSAYYSRKQLYYSLDRARKHPVVWVSAPAGAGKTTLVASYLRERKLTAMWYHLDAGDTDLGSFFYYLGQVGRMLAPRRRPLPALTPEYFRGLPAFAHNFFRAIFDRMKAPSALVFDSYECIDPQAPLHDLLAMVLEETPRAVTVIILSRSDPPAAFARWRASSKFAFLDWDMLKLRPEETLGICRLRCGDNTLDPAAVAILHEQAEGWVSGLILMLAQVGELTLHAIPPDARSRSAVFDYFASEIFARSPPVLQNILLKTALLPHVDPQVAHVLTSHPDAEVILTELARKNYFVTRLASGAYRYHTLFREFLLMKAQTQFTRDQWYALQRKAAVVLIDAGLHEPAAVLLQETGDEEGLTQLIYQRAQEMVASGRGSLLEQWIRVLSADWVETRPWLSYWFGMCLLPFDREQALLCFTRAYEQFKSSDDFNARLLAWCGAVDSIVYERRNYALLDTWINELETIRGRLSGESRPEIAALVAGSAFVALTNRRPDHPEISLWCERAWDVVMHSSDSALRAKIGPHLLVYFTWWTRDLAKTELLLNTIRPLMERQHTAPLIQTAWCAMEAAYHWTSAENQTCIKVVEEGLAIADKSGVHAWDTMICGHGVWAALSSGESEIAERYLQRLAVGHDREPPDRERYYLYCSALKAQSEGRYESAKEYTKTALALVESAGLIITGFICRIDYGRILFYCGDEEGARQAVLATQRTARSLGAQTVEYHCFLVLAEMALVKGDDDACRDALSACLAVGKRLGLCNHTWWNSDTMGRLYVKALEWEIETEYVIRIIRLHNLIPTDPSLHLDTWPWPVKIYILGRFSLVKDDVPIKFASKAQKKPLELLKALIAFGVRDIAQEKLAEALWPDADGDYAYQNFKMTLHRLRKLIGAEMLIVEEGKLSLDPRRCWIDLWALQRVMHAQFEATDVRDPDSLVAVADRARRLYRGPFLGAEDGAPWMLATREHLRNQYVRFMTRLSEHLRAVGRADEALACYHHGLEFDAAANETEALHQELQRH